MTNRAGQTEQHPIIFFDGYCGLCDRFISQVLANPKGAQFRFSPLQGETFARMSDSKPETQGLDSILVYDPETKRLFAHSDATIFILSRLEGSSKAGATLLKWVPRPFRNTGYRAVAKIRYKIFGRRDTCRLPTPEERALFLP